MKVKELIEKLKEFDDEVDVVIRFAVSNQDDIGYVLTPKIIDEYITSSTAAIYANYEHTAEDCAFMGQVDLKQAYENGRRQNEENENICTYKQIEEDYNIWSCSNCECAWRIEEGTPANNNVNYCPECGARIKEIIELREDK